MTRRFLQELIQISKQTSAQIRTPLWSIAEGPDQDVVISTRCRIARNLPNFPYPWRCSDGQRKDVAERLLNCADRTGHLDDRSAAIMSDSLSQEQIYELMEFRCVTREWLARKSHQWFWPSLNRNLSILINEEDHLRIQTIEPGFALDKTETISTDMANAMEDSLRFAFSPSFGYLTPSLPNVGSAMRIGCLLHLPALTAFGDLEKLFSAAEDVGCIVRGLYGEGSEGTGAFYQLSNRHCFGPQDSRTVARARSAVSILIDSERASRSEHFGTNSGKGDLARATEESLTKIFLRDLNQFSLMSHLSLLRLAICQGILPGEIHETTNWIALAGMDRSLTIDNGETVQRYESIRRTAAVRNALRRYADG